MSCTASEVHLSGCLLSADDNDQATWQSAIRKKGKRGTVPPDSKARKPLETRSGSRNRVSNSPKLSSHVSAAISAGSSAIAPGLQTQTREADRKRDSRNSDTITLSKQSAAGPEETAVQSSGLRTSDRSVNAWQRPQHDPVDDLISMWPVLSVDERPLQQHSHAGKLSHLPGQTSQPAATPSKAALPSHIPMPASIPPKRLNIKSDLPAPTLQVPKPAHYHSPMRDVCNALESSQGNRRVPGSHTDEAADLQSEIVPATAIEPLECDTRLMRLSKAQSGVRKDSMERQSASATNLEKLQGPMLGHAWSKSQLDRRKADRSAHKQLGIPGFGAPHPMRPHPSMIAQSSVFSGALHKPHFFNFWKGYTLVKYKQDVCNVAMAVSMSFSASSSRRIQMLAWMRNGSQTCAISKSGMALEYIWQRTRSEWQ